jgi:hypothetical protein
MGESSMIPALFTSYIDATIDRFGAVEHVGDGSRVANVRPRGGRLFTSHLDLGCERLRRISSAKLS